MCSRLDDEFVVDSMDGALLVLFVAQPEYPVFSFNRLVRMVFIFSRVHGLFDGLYDSHFEVSVGNVVNWLVSKGLVSRFGVKRSCGESFSLTSKGRVVGDELFGAFSVGVQAKLSCTRMDLDQRDLAGLNLFIEKRGWLVE